jgi:hypothetical protein
MDFDVALSSNNWDDWLALIGKDGCFGWVNDCVMVQATIYSALAKPYHVAAHSVGLTRLGDI